ncbi:helix-turn-helix transcriptional regulator [Saliphagus sp. GCM10025334]
MVFNSLRDRLSSLFGSETADAESVDGQSASGTPSDPDAAPEEPTTGPAARENKETLSYAEQVEYGADDREIADEDKVLRLLVKRGGRVDETTILEETGWKESHLSAVVEEMEDDNQVSAITVGRKRVICRRGFEPKGYRSHLNE